jgi:hypothetical protein
MLILSLIVRGSRGTMDRTWQQLVEVLEFLFEDPKGPIYIVVADGSENPKHLVVSPPPSLKAFRESPDPESLLNAGIPGNGLLPKEFKLNPSKIQMLLERGWVRPQHPFNNYFSLGNPNGRSLRQLFEFCIESFVDVFDLNPGQKFGMRLATVDAEVIQERFLDYLPAENVWMLRNMSTAQPEVAPPIALNVTQVKVIDSVPVTVNEPEQMVEQVRPVKVPSVPEPEPIAASGNSWKDSKGSDVHVGAQVTFMVSNKGQALSVPGILIGERNKKALIQVSSGGAVPKNDYAVPWSVVSLTG